MSPMDSSHLTEKSVSLITGCSSGFGRLIAETLARKGYYVFATMRDVNNRNANVADKLRTLAERESLHLHVLELDVTDDDSVQRAVDDAIARAGRVDILINNAGYVLVGLTEACTLEQARDILDTNFLGAVRMNRAILPHMRMRGSGLLIHISSGGGRIAFPGLGLYSASKFALEALGEAYRYELAPEGIDCVIVEPGAFPTAVFSKTEHAADHFRESTYVSGDKIPQRMFELLGSSRGDPQEVADCVLRIVEMSAGNRPLRVRVGSHEDAFKRLNDYSDQLQTEYQEALGIAQLMTFQARRPTPSTDPVNDITQNIIQ